MVRLVFLVPFLGEKSDWADPNGIALTVATSIPGCEPIWNWTTEAGSSPSNRSPVSIFDEEAKAARTKYPSRLSYTIRIGEPAAFRIGGVRGRCLIIDYQAGTVELT